MLLNLIRNGGFDIVSVLTYIISSLCVIFFILPVHEFAHGFVATKLGDYTPRYEGRLTLNPMAHIDYLGALCTLLFGFGWAKAVQVNPRNFQNPKWGMVITAAAGPVSNLIFAFITTVLMYTSAVITDASGLEFLVYVVLFFRFLTIMNIYLAVFNLIPIPPFDGSRILFSLLPTKYYFAIMKYERYIFIGLIIVIATGVLSRPLTFLSDGIYDGMSYVVGSIFNLFW